MLLFDLIHDGPTGPLADLGSGPLRERDQGLSLIDVVNSNRKPADAHTSLGISVGITAGKAVAKRGMVFRTRHISGSALPRAIQLGSVFCGIAVALGATAESISEEVLTRDLVGKTRLTSTEITRLFSNVIDRGEVQSERGISAETHWYTDGTFVSRWWTQENPASDASNSGALKKVSGRWRAERDLRCVTFNTGTQSDWLCAEVWLLDDGRILSLNPDGSAHGLHRLSPLK